MKTITAIYALLLMGFILSLTAGCKKDDVAKVPALTTSEITEITTTAAISGGNVTNDGGAAITSKGVCLNTATAPTIDNVKIESGTGTGSYVSNVTGLIPGQTYYLRAFATNSVGTSYGNEVSFSTLTGVATLTTNDITVNIGTAAISGGNITSDGGSAIIARGICYSNSIVEPTIINGTITSNGNGIGSFTSNITGLNLNTIYYVRAYATNAIGTYYGSVLSFTTLDIPKVTTSPIYDIFGISAKAGGVITDNGGGQITGQGLCWSTGSNPTIASNKTTSFGAVMTGLTTGGSYYVRAYATNAAGTGYGDPVFFKSGKLIGSSLSGGLVFYNNGNGGGLICTTADIGTGAIWGCNNTLISGTSIAIGTGLANTNVIVARCTTDGIAAKICKETAIFTGFTVSLDWYLPSKDELNLMYHNLHLQALGGFNTALSYWSSSEISSTSAFAHHFGTGNQVATSKSIVINVRAVKAF